MPLNPRQQLFAEQYLIDRNGTQACIRAGYSANSAAVTASRLLRNANVQQAVAAGTVAVAEAAELDAAWVLSNLRDAAENSDARLSDRIRATELIGKHLGMFVDRVHHTESYGNPALEALTPNQLGELEALWISFEADAGIIDGEGHVLE